jgi:hypothetical protein
MSHIINVLCRTHFAFLHAVLFAWVAENYADWTLMLEFYASLAERLCQHK